MQRIQNVITDTIKDYKTSAKMSDFEAGQLDGIITLGKRIRLKIEEIQRQEEQLNISGVCGICYTTYDSYEKASKCCSRLKGKDYEQELNQVFQVRRESNI
jgi:hypothetical protein